jgi:hypothetical protein
MMEGEEKGKKTWFVSPRQTHTTITRILRAKDAIEISDLLSKMCDRYWEFFCNIHDGAMDRQKQTQSWFHFQAYAKILKEYGWWNYEMNQPKDWAAEEVEYE